MINKQEYRVQYFDTDAYGVVWHGAYFRYMEMGRVALLFDLGLEIHKLQEQENIVMPVVDINIKYKFSAKLMDNIILTTEVKEITKTSVLFEQTISIKETGTVCTSALVRAVALKDGKIMRNLDELLGVKI